jgi:hypothetical protein
MGLLLPLLLLLHAAATKLLLPLLLSSTKEPTSAAAAIMPPDGSVWCSCTSGSDHQHTMATYHNGNSRSATTGCSLAHGPVEVTMGEHLAGVLGEDRADKSPRHTKPSSRTLMNASNFVEHHLTFFRTFPPSAWTK